MLIAAQGENSVIARIQDRGNGDLLLKVSNTHPFPIEVIGYGRKPDKSHQDLSSPLFVFSNPQHQPPTYADLAVPDKTKYLFYRVAGIDSIYTAAIVDWQIPTGVTQRQMMFGDSLKSNELFEVSGNNILFKKGFHVSQNDITIPAGYQVFFEAGASLDLQKEAAFISLSPVFMLGTEDNPVQVFSSDDTANGFTVIQAGEPSRIEYTRFDKLNTLNKGG
ncbi:MAG: hypothetical protein DWQ02_11200 [Bacteroidetes bacterium]|nr:MAG: hypothetical protein DWQ02_11200 [Bacteroidota bacterium]